MRTSEGQKLAAKDCVPLSFEPGKAYQFERRGACHRRVVPQGAAGANEAVCLARVLAAGLPQQGDEMLPLEWRLSRARQRSSASSCGGDEVGQVRMNNGKKMDWARRRPESTAFLLLD